MFWDTAAKYYDIFEKLYNGKVNKKLGIVVGELIDSNDDVLECACGTGMLSKHIAPKCNRLIATDFSTGMLQKTKKNLSSYSNVKVRRANIMELQCKSECFDKVVAGNVIHLLDDPVSALQELNRVCKPGGKIIIPTYVNKENNGNLSLFIKLISKLGANFNKHFDYNSYKEFFYSLGVTNVKYVLIKGRMPCAIAIITKE